MKNFNDFIAFVISPTYIDTKSINFKSIFILFIAYILFAIFFSSFIVNKICGTYNIIHKGSINDLYFSIFIGCLLAPFYEEIIFRLLFIFNKQNVIITITTSLITALFFYFRSNYIYFITFTIIGFALIILVRTYSLEKIVLYTKNKFKVVFWISSLFFGILHTANYSGNITIIILFSFFLSISQIFLGLILGYIRINYGFFIAVFFHMVINSIFLLPGIFL